MATWKLSDGTRVLSGGRVVGKSEVAGSIRWIFRHGEDTGKVQVQVGPPPGGTVQLDLANDWLLNRWLRSMAARLRLKVKTTYRGGRPPPAAAEILGRKLPPSKPGTVF